MTEVWKDIPGYEGLYQVSNLGRVKSYDRKVNSPIRNSTRMVERIVKGQIIKPEIANNGYLVANLWKNNVKKRICIHRLVAEVFIDNPDNKPCVNHKDYNRQNASVENLEWVTHQENTLYSRDRMSEAHIGKSSIPNKTGEMYVRRTPTGKYKLCIERLGIYKTFNTVSEAIKAREVIIGW